ncbi:MAG: putative ThiF family protein [Bacteroidota bacterium]|jgi:molybdopterin/thiamine biosynthesis adenylyltransferase|nr:putative ThiF family protein [Bacteroidota bacterium]
MKEKENGPDKEKGNDKKLNISVMIEGDKIFTEEYNDNQKLNVIVNKTLAKLQITADGRELKREDGTPLLDLNLTIAEVGLRDGEVLRFFKKAVKPDRDKGFALQASAGWHKEKPLENLFSTEIGILERGLGGDFTLTKIVDPKDNSGRLGVLGTLKFAETQSSEIKIIFPTRYPYSCPKVIPVHAPMSALAFQQLPPKLFNKGNQYNDGAMCLLRGDQWNRNEHNIGWCLRRAQEWLTFANSPGGFPKDKVVLENPAHLPHTGQVILPKEYIPPDAKTGDLILTQFKPNHYIMEDNVIPNHVFTLNLGKETFRWYRFPSGTTLQSIIPAITGNTFVDAFRSHFGINIADGTHNQNVALYFPDDSNRWYFFKLQIQKLSNNTANLNIAYYISRIVDRDLYLRTHDVFDDQILNAKKVTIIGLGALGSEVGRSIARNGVGTFNLFDNDTFEIGNSVRHAADLFYIGESKTSVVKQLIIRSNPNILVNTYNVNVLDDEGLLESSLFESDLCIVLTAEEQVDYLINEYYAARIKIPFVFARVSSGGLSGSIQIVNFKDSACLNCLRLHSADTLPQPKTKAEFKELPPEYGSCSTPAFPGSEVDTKEIALQVSRISLQLLLANSKSNYAKIQGQQFYWHGPHGSAKQKPFTWEIKNIEKHGECEICNNRN